jgi:hypothetical protein
MHRLGLVLIAAACALTTSCRCRCAPAACPVPTSASEAGEEVVRRVEPDLRADTAILDSLRSKRVDLRWEEYPFADALAHLRTITGVDMHVSPQASGAMTAAGGTVTLWVDGVSVEDLLVIITSEIGLTWTVRGGRVVVEANGESPSLLTLRYYDVNDLVAFVPFGEESAAATPVPKDHAVDFGPPVPLTQSEVLEVTIRTLIEHASWSDESRTLEAKKGVLVVRAEPATHEQIVRYLNALRTAMR